jgi:hypothetical protein
MAAWKDRAEEALTELRALHPDFVPSVSERDWSIVVKNVYSDVPGSCRLCGLALKGTVQNLLSLKQAPGSAIPGVIHDCVVLQKASEDAALHLAKTEHNLVKTVMLQQGEAIIRVAPDGVSEVLLKAQRRAFVISRCQKCDYRSQTQVRYLISKHLPGCWCHGGVWSGQNGFLRAIRIIRSIMGPYRPKFDLVWWRTNVTDVLSTIPLHCSLCSKELVISIKYLKAQIQHRRCECQGKELKRRDF